MPFVHHYAPAAVPASADLCLVVQGDRLLARPEMAETVTLPCFAELAGWTEPAGKPQHLGKVDGVPCWSMTVARAEAEAPAGWQWHDTRSLLGLLTPGQTHAMSCARQLLWWDRRHQYCGVCGTPMVEVVEERARRCPRCQALYFPSVSPAIIVAVTRGPELLLAHNRNFRPGMFSLLAGFLDAGETLEQATIREVREEVGIEIADLRYITSQPWPFPNSLMIGFTARWTAGDLKVDGKEITEAGWYRKDALPEVPRTGTVARHIIDRWMRAEA